MTIDMNSCMRNVLTATIIWITISCQTVCAAEYFSWLSVRYSDRSVKTFLQGPYKTKAWCDKLNQTTWDNVLTACGTCSTEMKYCDRIEKLQGIYSKLIRRERAAMPYVVATPEGRIFFSGVPTSTAVDECHRLAASFKGNGYSDARCVLP